MPAAFFALALLVLKWHLIWRYGNATPFWDQWDAEAANLYLPWISGQMGIADWLRAHNEHRILMPRILLVALFELNGREWNPLLQMAVNAVIHVVALVLLMTWLGRGLGLRAQMVLWGAGLLTLLPPFGHQSVLEGIQSAYYFFFLFSFLHLHSMATDNVFGVRWWWGLAAGVLSYLSLASGAISLLAGALVLAARSWSFRQSSGFSTRAVKSAMVASVLAVCLVIAAVWMTPTQPAHAGMRAHSLSEIFHAALIMLSWPSPVLWLGLVTIHLPWVVLLVRMVCSADWRMPHHFFMMGLGLWVTGHMAAIALARATEVEATRYLDILVVALPLNVAAWLYIRKDLQSKARILWLSLGGIWGVLVLWGCVRQLPDVRDALGHRRVTALFQEHNLRAYLCTGDMRYLEDKGVLHVPYPHPRRLARLLDMQAVRHMLPRSLYNTDPSNPRGVPGDSMCRKELPEE